MPFSGTDTTRRCPRVTWTAGLLASTMLVGAAHAADVLWDGSNSNFWNDAANWTPALIPQPGDTAVFDGASPSTLSVRAGNVDIATIRFDPHAAPGYTFNITNNTSFVLTGAGVVNNSGQTQTFRPVFGNLAFINGASAGNAVIDGGNGSVSFSGTASAGTAQISMVNGFLSFSGNASAANATITNDILNAAALFLDNATAGNATITNISDMRFEDSSTAGTATITSVAGADTIFQDTSSAQNARLIAGGNNGAQLGFMRFEDDARGGSAEITANAFGTIVFQNSATAENATVIVNNNGSATFSGNSTGGNARLIANAGGSVDFTSTTGTNGDGRVTAGSIEGAGTFILPGLGTLVVGSNDRSTSVSGSIVEPGGNPGALEKVGTGTLALAAGGTFTYTGATTVTAGTLQIDGSIVTSSLTTVNGGTLNGTGTLGDTTVAGGTFAPGNGTANSTQNVTGTLAFTGGTYTTFVDPTTASQAVVSSSATLGGATVRAVFAPGSYVNRQYTILTAGSISGTFNPTVQNTNLPNFTASLSYDATHAYLNLAFGFTMAGLSGNQQNVASTLNNFFNTTGGIPMAFGALTSNGLSQVSGEAGAATVLPMAAETNQFINAVLGGAFGGPSGGDVDGGALGYAAEQKTPRASREGAEAFAAMPVKTQAVDAFTSRWSLWASSYGGTGMVTGDAAVGSSNTSSRIYGAVAGATYRVAPSTLAGFALGGAGTNFSLDGGFGSGKADIFHAAIYGRHIMGPAYVAGLFGYGWQDASTDRTVTAAGTDVLQASFHPQTLSGRLEAGYRLSPAWLDATPYGALQASAFYLPSYAESATSGSNQFALTYGSRTASVVRSELGIRLAKAYAVPSGVVTLKGRVAWAHDSYEGDNATATFQTLPGATFAVNGAQPNANVALISAGVDYQVLGGWSLGASFDGEFSGNSSQYAGKGAIRYAW